MSDNTRKEFVKTFFITFSAFLLFCQPTFSRQDILKSESGEAVKDTIVVKEVLNTVRTHVLSLTKDRRKPLVVKEGKKSRRFIVVEFLSPVSLNKGLYTARIDVDEFDHKIPRILYVDVKPLKKSFRVIRIRIGPNHFRNKGPGN